MIALALVPAPPSPDVWACRCLRSTGFPLYFLLCVASGCKCWLHTQQSRGLGPTRDLVATATSRPPSSSTYVTLVRVAFLDFWKGYGQR
jgi:hypothetical protein